MNTLAAELVAIVESANDAIIGMTRDGVITSWNPAAERLYGWPAAEAIGQSIEVLVTSAGKAAMSALLAGIARGERHPNVTAVHVRRDTSPVSVALSMSPMLDASRQVVGGAMLVRPVGPELAFAEREQAQAPHALPAGSVGHLADGIAHELNNLLSVILGHLELAEEKMAAGQWMGPELKAIHRAATHSADVARRLLASAGKQTLQPGSQGRDVAVPEAGAIESAGETILAVEDDPAVLEVTAAVLRGLGYTVHTAATPDEAIALAHEHRIDLLMTDVIMPEMHGPDLARHVRAIVPDLKCLFVSGYTADVISHSAGLGADAHFLAKPYSRKQLSATLRALLAG